MSGNHGPENKMANNLEGSTECTVMNLLKTKVSVCSIPLIRWNVIKHDITVYNQNLKFSNAIKMPFGDKKTG